MQKSCKVKQCFICKKFGHIESKCIQKSKSENKANFSQGCEFSFICGSRESKTCELILDFGCSSHVFCDKDFFVELDDDCSKVCVNANNSLSPMRGQVVAKIFLEDKHGVSHVLSLIKCLYVSEHSRNLLSVSALTQKGAKVVFDDLCELRCSDKVSFPFERGKWLVCYQYFFSLLIKFSHFY